jgi:hypothetical protein
MPLESRTSGTPPALPDGRRALMSEDQVAESGVKMIWLASVASSSNAFEYPA